MVKLSKKHLGAGTVALLILGSIISIVILISNIDQLHREVAMLQETTREQAKQLQASHDAILSIDSNNGTALQVCLDNAAKTYSNSIKSADTVTNQRPDGSTQSVMDFTSWTKINDKLAVDRASCNAKYK